MVGLGNPGPRYTSTRHNVGFEIAGAFARRARISLDERRFEGAFGTGRVVGLEVGVLLPGTFMNESGRSVASALEAHASVDPARDLLVVYDDLDLPLGRIRLRARGRAGGQRGMQSVLDAVGSELVPRLRFGVGRPRVGEPARSRVLAPFSADEREVVEARIDVAAEAVLHCIAHGVASAMDRYNRADPDPDPEPEAR